MPLYTFRILGPVELVRHDGVAIYSVLNQAKRTALLAYLAMAAPGTRTRGEVIELFWGDKPEDEGRHALSQALYFLRRSLGKSALIAEGETLGIDPDVVESDVLRFRAHLERGRLEEAVALYRGDLLDHLPDVPGLDRWLDEARESLRRQVVDALERLSLAAEEAGDYASAIRWAERAHEIAPYHEAPMRRLLSSLMADSQPLRAREEFERFITRLRDELGAEPSPLTEAILRRPASMPAAGRLAMVAAGDAATGNPTGDALPPTTSPAPGAGATNSVPDRPVAKGTVGLRASRVRRWATRGALTVIVLTLVHSGASTQFEPAESRAALVESRSESRVGVFPFLYRGDPELAYLGDGIAELVGISLHSLEHVSTLDPRALAAWAGQVGAAALPAAVAAKRARDLGADHFIIGTVVEAGGQIHVTARMHRADGNLVAAVSGRVPGEEHLFDLVDDLVRQFVASGALPEASDLERSAALTTESLSALRNFMRGERYFRGGRYAEAERAFDDAVRDDPSFALAYYRSAIAAIWRDDADFDSARAKVSRALSYRNRVSPLESDLFLALHEFLHGRPAPAERLYQAVLLRQPENVEAWFQLAETRFHYGGLQGRSVLSSDEAWRKVIALNPQHRAALIHLSALAALQRDPALDFLEARVNPGDYSSVYTPQVRALRVFTSGSEGDRLQFTDELRRHPGRTVATTAAYASRYLRDPAVGARIARILTDPSRPPADRAAGHLLLAHFELARGRRNAARLHLEQAQRLDSLKADTHRLFLTTLPAAPVTLRVDGARFDAVPRLEIADGARALVAFDGSVHSALRVYGRALAYHRAGGEDGALISAARQLAEAAENSPDGPMIRSLARGLLAERHLTHGDTAAARSELQASINTMERWYEHLREDYLRSLARERFLLAESEIAAGHLDAAESILRTFGDNSVAELPYLVPGLIRIGEIRERAGDAEGAAEAYRRALDLWSDAEPSFDPLLRELKARIDALSAT